VKVLLLIISVMFFITSCEDTGEQNTSSQFRKFSKVEKSLFAHSDTSKNKYLRIDGTDSVGQRLEVLTYEEEGSSGPTKENIDIYSCDTDGCKTNEVNSRFSEIELLEDSTKIVIRRSLVQPNGTVISTSNDTYFIVED